jgi:hypothetical protein
MGVNAAYFFVSSLQISKVYVHASRHLHSVSRRGDAHHVIFTSLEKRNPVRAKPGLVYTLGLSRGVASSNSQKKSFAPPCRLFSDKHMVADCHSGLAHRIARASNQRTLLYIRALDFIDALSRTRCYPLHILPGNTLTAYLPTMSSNPSTSIAPPPKPMADETVALLDSV